MFAGDSTDKVLVNIEASSQAFYLEYTVFTSPFFAARRYRLGVGIDVDSSAVELSADRVSEAGVGNEMVAFTSNLLLVSLRLAPSINFAFSDWLLSIDSAAVIPLSSQVSQKYEEDPILVSVSDPEAQETLIKAIEHKAASVGFELSLGLGLVF